MWSSACSRAPRAQQRGVSLVELMIGIAIGLVIVAGGLVVFGTSVRGSTETLRSARLNQDLATASAIVANELRRAGFSRRDPPVLTPTSIQIPESSCVIYEYDADGNGTIAATERRGFRLAGGVLMTGASVTNCASITEPLTDPTVVTVTQLQFDTEGSKCRNIDGAGYWRTATNTQATAFPCNDTTLANLRLCNAAGTCAPSAPAARSELVSSGNRLTETRRVNVRIAGRLTNDTAVSKSMATTVTVANVIVTREP